MIHACLRWTRSSRIWPRFVCHSSDTGLVKDYVEQQWQAYSANLDCVFSSTCSLDALKGAWMQQNYLHCLQTYVDALDRPMSSIGSPLRGENLSLGQVISCSPGSSKKPTSQVGPGSPGAAGKQLFTELHELGEKLAVSHTVIGRVLWCLPGTVSIEVRGETLARYG